MARVRKFMDPKKELRKNPADGEYERNARRSYEDVKETIDDFLEQAHASIDKMGRNAEAPLKPRQLVEVEKAEEVVRRTNHQLRKPQLFFKQPVDNSYNPFVPIITKKWFELEPLPQQITQLQEEYKKNPEQYCKVLIHDAKKPQQALPHPYRLELEELQYTPHQLATAIPEVKVKEVHATPLIYVHTVEQLEELKRDLLLVTEFAVDLEHHSYRSYLGFTCLMQISTRDCDYIIDVLVLREHMHILAEVSI
jgi:hypothetical protein